MKNQIDKVSEGVASSARIYPGSLIKNVIIGDFCIIGEKPHGKTVGNLQIGPNSVVRSHSVIYAGNVIGKRFKCGHHIVIRENNRIGNDVIVGTNSEIAYNVRIGNGVIVHSNVFIPENSVLEDNCFIGPCAILTNAKYPKYEQVKNNLIGPVIARNAKIGAGAIILPGIRVGEFSLVGAGSVVTKNVPDNAIVIGNPAKIVKNADEVGYI